jgi:hypothetical protein
LSGGQSAQVKGRAEAFEEERPAVDVRLKESGAAVPIDEAEHQDFVLRAILFARHQEFQDCGRTVAERGLDDKRLAAA